MPSTPPRPGLRQALHALAFRDYRQFALSLLLTSIGAQLVQTAVLWQVYEMTGSAVALGLTGVARAVPHMVLSLVGGVVADRVNRARLIQVGQFGNALLILGLTLLTWLGRVEVWHLYVVTLLNSAFSAATQPARTALIPSLIPRERLVSAVALNATIMQSSQIVGPALGGLVIAATGLGSTYLLNALAYLFAMLVIFGIRTPATPAGSGETPWRDFLEGLAFVRRRRVILSLLLLDLGATVFGSYRALVPIFAERLGVGAGGYGVLSAAPGVGSLAASALVLSLGDMRHKGMHTVTGVLAYAGAIVLMAVSPWFMLTLAASALLGATNAWQMIPRNSVILTLSPDAMRGRVEAFRSMLAGGGPPLGYALSGALAALLGPVVAMMAGAAACAITVGLVVVGDRELRDPTLGMLASGSEHAATPGSAR